MWKKKNKKKHVFSCVWNAALLNLVSAFKDFLSSHLSEFCESIAESWSIIFVSSLLELMSTAEKNHFFSSALTKIQQYTHQIQQCDDKYSLNALIKFRIAAFHTHENVIFFSFFDKMLYKLCVRRLRNSPMQLQNWANR